MSNLRKSVDNNSLAKLHAKYFRPENSILVVTGTVDAKRLFQKLDNVGERNALKILQFHSQDFVILIGSLSRDKETEIYGTSFVLCFKER